MTTNKPRKTSAPPSAAPGYDVMLSGVAGLLEQARRTSARAVNAIMTATYWEIGRRIVEYEQGGEARAEYGGALIARLSVDLTACFGRGFGPVNLSQMRKFYLCWLPERIFQMSSEKSSTAAILGDASPAAAAQEKARTAPAEFSLQDIAARFPLSWSSYVRLISVNFGGRNGQNPQDADGQGSANSFSRGLMPL